MIYEPPDGLFQRIMARLRHEERRLRAAKRNMVIFGIAGLVSLAALIPLYQAMTADIAASGLPDMLSLVASDTAIVAALWKEFLFSFLEFLPAVSIAAALAVLLASLASLHIVATNFEKIADHRLING